MPTKQRCGGGEGMNRQGKEGFQDNENTLYHTKMMDIYYIFPNPRMNETKTEP